MLSMRFATLAWRLDSRRRRATYNGFQNDQACDKPTRMRGYLVDLRGRTVAAVVVEGVSQAQAARRLHDLRMRSFAWLARCRRLARDYERLGTTLAGLHFVAFAMLMLMLTRLFGGNPWKGI